MSLINIMVVGLGRWAQLWLEDIQKNDNYKIASIVDNDFETIDEVSAEFGINKEIGYINLEKAIHETNPDVALITLPPAAHYAAVKKCIEMKVNILSEKPLAVDMDEARDLLKLTQEHDVIFMVSQDYRWQPTPQTLQKVISEGIIGNIGYIIYRHLRSIKVGGWREKMKDVVLEDMAIHHFDLLRLFANSECKEVYAESYNPYWSWFEGGATTSVNLTFENNIHVNYFGSWITTGEENGSLGEIRFEGEKGSLRVDSDGNIYHFDGENEQLIENLKMEFKQRSYALQEMKLALDQGQQPETSIHDNINSFAITRAAIKSAHLHRPVKIEEVFE